MIKAILRLATLLLVASSAATAGGQGAGPERGAFTDADLNLYVDTAGNDANDCTGPGASACATIQGAVDKVPKRIRHNVTITVGIGHFAGAVIEGFSVESSHRPGSGAGAGLDIRGTMVNVDPKDPNQLLSGPSTGTATNCDGGGYSFPRGEYGTDGIPGGKETRSDPRQHATLTKTNAGWTSGNLRGKFLALTSGTGAGQILAIEDNTDEKVTLAGYWDDYHQGWVNCGPNLGKVEQGKDPPTPTTFAIQEPGTIIFEGMTLPSGIGGIGDEQKAIENWAAFIASNLRGGATSHYLREGDHTQYMIQRFKIVQSLRSVLFIDSSENVSARYISSDRLSGGAALYLGQNSPSWSVKSSYNKGVPRRTETFAAVSRFYTADTQIAMFGNVIDGGGSYFGDSASNITQGRVSVQFNGESIRNLVADGGHIAAIDIHSGADVHIVGTLIDGTPTNDCLKDDGKTATNCPRIPDCIRLGGGRGGESGHLFFEGGDLSNCGSAGLSAFGNWIVEFINWPASSEKGQNGRFGIQASNGAKIFGVSTSKFGACPFSGGVSISGIFDDMTFDNLHSVSYKAINTPLGTKCELDVKKKPICKCDPNSLVCKKNPSTKDPDCDPDPDTIHGPQGGFFTSGYLSTQQNINYPEGTLFKSGGLSVVPEIGHAQGGDKVKVTFGTPFSVTPECVCNDQTAATAVQCNPSPTTLEITGPKTDTISYQCFGNK